MKPIAAGGLECCDEKAGDRSQLCRSAAKTSLAKSCYRCGRGHHEVQTRMLQSPHSSRLTIVLRRGQSCRHACLRLLARHAQAFGGQQEPHLRAACEGMHTRRWDMRMISTRSATNAVVRRPIPHTTCEDCALPSDHAAIAAERPWTIAPRTEFQARAPMPKYTTRITS